MNILLTTDNNFVQHCAVAMVSILKNNTNVSLYLLTEGLTENNEKILTSLVSENNGKIVIIKAPTEIVQQFPMPSFMSSHISIATYYRLFVTMLLPEFIDKIIYLDCDIVVRGSLEDLWNTDIDNYALAAVYQNNEWALDNNSYERLGFSSDYGYFNAGMLLMNLSYWRKNNVQQRLFSFIKNNYAAIHSHDQDVLNAVLHKEVLPVSCKWNVLALFFSDNLNELHFPLNLSYKDDFLQGIKNNPTVVHYVFKPKPWETGCYHPYKKEYYHYLSFTAWKGWNPKFNLDNFYKYFILRKLSPIIVAIHPLTMRIRKIISKNR